MQLMEIAVKNKSIIQADLTNKVALITGAAQGIGAACAEFLSQNGALIVVSGRVSSMDRVKKVVNKIESSGGRAIPLILDLTEFDGFDKKIEEITRQVGHIDILVNNAAVSIDMDMLDISVADWDQHMDTNLKGLFFLSQAVAKQMKKQNNGGSIINIAAVNGEKIRKNCISFGTSKAAVTHLTKAMAYELIEYGIRVNAIQLGLFESELVREWIKNDPKSKHYIAKIPAKRAGSMSDLAGPLLLLASDASSYMYGSVLKVDGGFAMDVFMDIDIQNS
jgi:NAD(P)-dependent dehydrogenase (short-subunit alcohol dehydrogenase family)